MQVRHSSLYALVSDKEKKKGIYVAFNVSGDDEVSISDRAAPRMAAGRRSNRQGGSHSVNHGSCFFLSRFFVICYAAILLH